MGLLCGSWMALLQWWFVVESQGAPGGLIYQVTSPILEGPTLMTWSPPRPHLLTQVILGIRISTGQGIYLLLFLPLELKYPSVAVGADRLASCLP